jgi:hypothetical protein
MNIDRNVQRLGGLEDRPEFLIVKIFALGVGIDDGAFKLEPCDGAFELLGSGLRATSSAAVLLKRSGCSLGNRCSNLMVRPSM